MFKQRNKPKQEKQTANTKKKGKNFKDLKASEHEQHRLNRRKPEILTVAMKPNFHHLTHISKHQAKVKGNR